MKLRFPDDEARSLLAALAVGIASGLVVALFTDVFVWTNKFRYEYLEKDPPLFAVVSFVSILGTAYFLKATLGNLQGSSTSYVVRSYHTKLGYIGFKELVVYTLGALSSVLGGAVVGPEGPGIALGAFFGYWIARLAKLRGEDSKKLALVGGAAGIASVFRAPLTAMAFAMEVPYKKALEGGIFLQALIATLTSYLITVALVGPQRLLLEVKPFKPPYPSFDLVAASIGVGLTAAFLTYLMYLVKHWSMEISEKFVHKRTWVALPALLTALVLLAYSVSPLIPGAGDVLTEKVFNEPDSFKVQQLAVIVLAKAVLMGLSLNWGTTGGIFMPLVAIGSAMGLMYAKAFALSHALEAIVIAGVSSLFASSMKTLLTSVLIGVEFLGFGAFFTSSVAAATGYLLTLPISLISGQLPAPPDVKKRSIIELYTKLKESEEFKKVMNTEVERITNKDVIRLTENMTVSEALEVVTKETHNYYPVVDSEDRVVGEVSLEELIVSDLKKRMKELMYFPKLMLYKKVPLAYALDLIISKDEDHAIVIDEKRKLVGVVTKADIIKHLLEMLKDLLRKKA